MDKKIDEGKAAAQHSALDTDRPCPGGLAANIVPKVEESIEDIPPDQYGGTDMTAMVKGVQEKECNNNLSEDFVTPGPSTGKEASVKADKRRIMPYSLRKGHKQSTTMVIKCEQQQLGHELGNDQLNADEAEIAFQDNTLNPVTVENYDKDKIRLIIQTYFGDLKRLEKQIQQEIKIGVGEEMSPVYCPKFGIMEGCIPPLPNKSLICPLVSQDRFFLAQSFDYLLDSMKTASDPNCLCRILNAMRVKLELGEVHVELKPDGVKLQIGSPTALCAMDLRKLKRVAKKVLFSNESFANDALRLDFVRCVLMKYYYTEDGELDPLLDPLRLAAPGVQDSKNPEIFHPDVMLVLRRDKDIDSYHALMWDALVDIMKLHGSDVNDWEAFAAKQALGKRMVDERCEAGHRSDRDSDDEE